MTEPVNAIATVPERPGPNLLQQSALWTINVLCLPALVLDWATNSTDPGFRFWFNRNDLRVAIREHGLLWLALGLTVMNVGGLISAPFIGIYQAVKAAGPPTRSALLRLFDLVFGVDP